MSGANLFVTGRERNSQGGISVALSELVTNVIVRSEWKRLEDLSSRIGGI